MKFVYEIHTNIEVGQTLYGIIGVSRQTYDGVYPIKVYEINPNECEGIVIFDIDQPCGFVSCDFSDMDKYVFETEEEANGKIKELDFGVGLFRYDW